METVNIPVSSVNTRTKPLDGEGSLQVHLDPNEKIGNAKAGKDERSSSWPPSAS